MCGKRQSKRLTTLCFSLFHSIQFLFLCTFQVFLFVYILITLKLHACDLIMHSVLSCQVLRRRKKNELQLVNLAWLFFRFCFVCWFWQQRKIHVQCRYTKKKKTVAIFHTYSRLLPSKMVETKSWIASIGATAHKWKWVHLPNCKCVGTVFAFLSLFTVSLFMRTYLFQTLSGLSLFVSI